MDNNLSNKKILLIGLIVFLLITGGIVAIVYWPKTHIDGLDISPEAVKAKCLEDANKMTDDELIDEIKNLKNPHEILSSVGEERIHFVNKQIINYLICKVSNDKNEETYNRAKNFIEELDIQEENKRKSLSLLNDTYDGFIYNKSYTIALTYGDINSDFLCPKYLSELCIDNAPDPKNQLTVDRCNNMCTYLKIVEDDEEYFHNEIIKEDPTKHWLPRMAITYRVKGKDMALRICEDSELTSKEKEDCINRVKILEEYPIKKDCYKNYFNSIIGVICD